MKIFPILNKKRSLDWRLLEMRRSSNCRDMVYPQYWMHWVSSTSSPWRKSSRRTSQWNNTDCFCSTAALGGTKWWSRETLVSLPSVHDYVFMKIQRLSLNGRDSHSLGWLKGWIFGWKTIIIQVAHNLKTLHLDLHQPRYSWSLRVNPQKKRFSRNRNCHFESLCPRLYWLAASADAEQCEEWRRFLIYTP